MAIMLPADSPWRKFLLFLGGAGPMLAALITSATTSPDESHVHLSDLLDMILSFPESRTLALSLAIPIFLTIIGLSLAKLLWPFLLQLSLHHPGSGRPSLYPDLNGGLLFVLLMLPCPMLLLEELGWRGFLLPELLHAGYSQHHASILVGCAWALWHLPLFHHGADPETPAHPLAAEHVRLIPRRMLVYCIMLSLVSRMITWVMWSDPSGSIWTPVLFHAAFNSSFGIFRVEKVARIFEPLIPIYLVVIIFLSSL